ncbi:MAG: phospholipid/cholesterol/gamma-HCH transport system substrate-binding protein [Myxococcota bacterium]|jgi:phospholipid/cholesterol/gamma-HCH transport system substrate-binding protein
MSGLSGAQKTRLGLFLGLAGLILVGTLVAMFGLAALEKRDQYIIRFEGSVSGLTAGSTVRYNGIDVGRVDKVRIDAEHVSGVEVQITLAEGTPVRSDTQAVLQMQGITGLKYIELSSTGDKDATPLDEGATIPSSRSMVDELTERATSIAEKLEGVLDNIVDMTGGQNADLLTGIMTDVRRLSSSTTRLITASEPQVAKILSEVGDTVAGLTILTDEARMTLKSVVGAADKAAGWVNPREVSSVLKRTQSALGAVERTSSAIDKSLATLRARMGPEELGKTIASVNSLAARSEKLVDRADVTLVRARDDLLRVLAALVDGAEAFGELAALLKEDPSALIKGKGGEERELP